MDGIAAPATQLRFEPWKCPVRTERETLQKRLAERLGWAIWGHGDGWKRTFFTRTTDGTVRCRATKDLVVKLVFNNEEATVPLEVRWCDKWFKKNAIKFPEEKKVQVVRDFWSVRSPKGG